MEPVQLWGSGLLSKSAVVTAQKRSNVYFELRPDGDKANIVIHGTPGLTSVLSLSTAPNGPIRGAYAGENYFYLVAGDSVIRITNDFQTQTVFTGLLSTSGTVGMDHAGTQLMIVDGTAGYILSGFDTASSTLAQITDSDFPDGAHTVAAIGGRFVVEKPNTGEFYVSASYDGTSWSGLDFATAEQNPDLLVGVDRLRGALILFGTKSIEPWQLAGGLNFPFLPITSLTQQWGLAARFSRARMDNTIYFLAQNQQGQVQVMRAGATALERVSSSDVENIINGFATKSDAVALSYLLDGHPMYQITFPSANRSFLYDVSTTIWSELSSGGTAGDRHLAQHAVVVNGKTYVTDWRQSNPELYELAPETYSDDGSTIKRIVRTRHLTRGGNKFTIDALRLEMETGVGLQTGQGSDPQIMVRISKDGGRSFGPERWIKLGAVGKYKWRVEVRRCGSAEDFVFEFAMTDPVKFCITRGLWDIRDGVH